MLGKQLILTGLQGIGSCLELSRDVEILIIGGSAGLLTGELPEAWTTGDIDILNCHLPQDRDAVLQAAEIAGRDLSMPPSWVSEDAGLFRWTLPDDWNDRKVHIGKFGHLIVFAIGRLDLIIMKFLAHRERDLEHLSQLHVASDEKQEVMRRLTLLQSALPEQQSRIERSLIYVKEWKTS